MIGDNQGDLSRAIALYGQITFSGTGTYTISGSGLDSDNGVLQPFSTSGTYAISAGGYGTISSPLSSGDAVFGVVSNDVFVGSSTEAGFNDLFVAARLTAPNATVSALKGSYSLAYIELSDGSPYNAYDAQWEMNPDGAGNLGTVQLRGYAGSTGSSAISQNLTGVKYIFSNGAANMMFPKSNNNALLAGNEYLYLSPDGNFVFGGSPEGWDFFVGVRRPSGTPSLSGLYYQAGIDLDDSTIGSGYGTLSTYYGAFSAANGSVVAHQRSLSGFSTSAIDYTYADTYSVGSDGNYTDTGTATQYVVGTGGFRVGVGIGPYLGISAAVPVAPLSGTGVYLNPAGVLNAASSAPFTAGVAPGELITLYGTNLAATTTVSPTIPFPTTLADVQVTINGTLAPIYYVSPGQASVIVPYGITGGIAEIQVNNNGATSNVVTVFTNGTSPGVFTIPVGGLGYAAALHASDNSLVTTDKPATAGEYISVYLTGLGAVTPTIPDGDAGPASTFSTTVNTITVLVGGRSATVSYSGLAPGLAGLYQINFQVPSGVATGDVSLGIAGPDSYTSEALFPIGPASTSSATTQVLGSNRPVFLIDSAHRKDRIGRSAGAQTAIGRRSDAFTRPR